MLAVALNLPAAAESYIELIHPVPQERLAEAQMQSETALANMQILQYTKRFEPVVFDIDAIDFPDDLPMEYADYKSWCICRAILRFISHCRGYSQQHC